jgi:hypothetical protein
MAGEAATEVGAAMEVGVVIDAAGAAPSFDLPQQQFFRFILVCVTHHFGIT